MKACATALRIVPCVLKGRVGMKRSDSMYIELSLCVHVRAAQ